MSQKEDAETQEVEEVTDLSSLTVNSKYQKAGELASKILDEAMKACVPTADVATICANADKAAKEMLSKVFTKGKMRCPKGLAFPTCVSVNETVGHFSPLEGESIQLKAGDIAKIDIGVHIDGYISAVAGTVVVGDDKVEDKRADVIAAAHDCVEAAVRLIQPGATSGQVMDAWAKICADYEVTPVRGVLSHELKKYVIDGSKVMLLAQNDEECVDEITFQPYEAYCVDVVVSSGSGTPKPADVRTTVFKRYVAKNVGLRLEKARTFKTIVDRDFRALPFGLRYFEDTVGAKVGIGEMKRNEMVEEYPVLKEKAGEVVAQFKYTHVITKTMGSSITPIPTEGWSEKVQSSKCVVDEDVKAILALSKDPNDVKRRNKERETTNSEGKTEEK